MMRLEQTVQAWGTPQFEAVLKQELARHADELPLQQGLAASSSVADTPPAVLLHGVDGSGGTIRVKAGILYQGLTGGCACAGDPAPDSEIDEYCEVRIEIDKASAAATVTLVETE